jgi:tetratricopeptide (TPR) repeat protein/archaellum component FlaF (FlaF/FlaG flagellin family)
MTTKTARTLAVLLALIVVFACDTSKTVDLELDVKVTLDGEPVSRADILVDGTAVGTTDEQGTFMQRLQKLPGTEVRVAVEKDAPGYRVEPWTDTFVTKLTEKGQIERYRFEADLKAAKYMTLAVFGNGEPLSGAVVKVEGQGEAATDDNGEYRYEFQKTSKRPVRVTVAKNGFEPSRRSLKLEPGQYYEITLQEKSDAPKKVAAAPAAPAPAPKPQKAAPVKKAAPVPAAKSKAPAPKVHKATVAVAALTEGYGVTRGIPNAAVYINGQKAGKTDTKGRYTYSYKGQPVEKAVVRIAAPGYIPETWETRIPFSGKQHVEHYFYPAVPKPIRLGIHGYVNNSPGSDLSDTITRLEQAVGNNLFQYNSFREIPKSSLKQTMLQLGLDLETVSTQGWQKTALINTVDAVIFGSVTAQDQGMVVETTVITADGKIILSQINRARKKENVRNTAKLIVASVIDQFPFEGTIAAAEGGGYKINLGKLDHKIRRGNEFRYMQIAKDRKGRLAGYREAGLLRVVDTDDTGSFSEVLEMKEDDAVRVGARVVRRVYLEERRESEQAAAILNVKGGVFPDEKPLWGVNVYLNNTWVGTTGSDGQVQIPLGLYEEHDLVLSRHGYKQLEETISVGRDKEIKEYFLEVASALFRVESEPSGAEVFVDGNSIGQTPILEGKLVDFGFRKIKLVAGDDYRDWEKVIEFNSSELELTGAAKVVFTKDYLKMGKTAEESGDIDGAIRAYAKVEKGNPDYSNCRRRLAQLYMDEKADYDAAIREFENVLALPENQQIIYKQFAITYTNLGHAYYEKGNQLIRSDPRNAARNFAEAIKRLETAKQNTRFFPTRQYDEAVHDTYYYMALAYHKLYLVTKKRPLIDKTDLAWREYFDFFPQKLRGQANFDQMRQTGEKYWSQIKDMKS